jgi:cellulose synthase/poly-beta-1,6-N-acetylglucosamine synthase-like glycosyltransferase
MYSGGFPTALTVAFTVIEAGAVFTLLVYFIQLVPRPGYHKMFDTDDVDVSESSDVESKTPATSTAVPLSSVDVLICCYKEEDNVILRTLRQCTLMRKPEGVEAINLYLLDDLGRDTRPALCELYGAVYVCRPNRCAAITTQIHCESSR